MDLLMWHDDEFAGGAFALFDPGQQTLLHEAIVAPEGAIESGLRDAHEVHETTSARS